MRECAELVPGEALGRIDETGDLEVPPSRIEMRNAAVVEHRPLEREGLAGGKAACGLGLLFQFAAVAGQDH